MNRPARKSAMLALVLATPILSLAATVDLQNVEVEDSATAKKQRELSAFNTTGVLSSFSGPDNRFTLDLSEDKKRASIKFQGFDVSDRWQSSIELSGTFDSDSPTSTLGTNDSLSNGASLTFGLDYVNMDPPRDPNSQIRVAIRNLCLEYTGKDSCTTPAVIKAAEATFVADGTQALCKTLGSKECSREKVADQVRTLHKTALQHCDDLDLRANCTTTRIEAIIDDRLTIQTQSTGDKLRRQQQIINACITAGVSGPCNVASLKAELTRAAKTLATVCGAPYEARTFPVENCAKELSENFLDRELAEQALCAKFEVEGNCTAKTLAAAVESAFMKARGRIGSRALTATVVPIKLTVGRQKYDYRNVATLASESDTEDVYAASVGFGKLVNNWFFGIGAQYEETYKSQPSRQLCNPTTTPPGGLECFTGSFGAPERVDTFKVFVDARKRFGDNKAVGLRVEHDEEAEQVNVELPIYFIASSNGLSAGVKLTWDDEDKDTQLAVFVGTPFSFF